MLIKHFVISVGALLAVLNISVTAFKPSKFPGKGDVNSTSFNKTYTIQALSMEKVSTMVYWSIGFFFIYLYMIIVSARWAQVKCQNLNDFSLAYKEDEND